MKEYIPRLLYPKHVAKREYLSVILTDVIMITSITYWLFSINKLSKLFFQKCRHEI